MFYGMYRQSGGAPSVPTAVSEGLAGRTVSVRWLREDATLPRAVHDKVESVARAGWKKQEAMEKDVRGSLSAEEHRDFFAQCRLPPAEIESQILEGISRVVAQITQGS
uniref:Uncharacterized protein n=2 Tax=Hemiselmis andersenii TaxID=464988 RepID=A0A7S0XUV6_HEMAN|mmetsp:Transcript_23386/g.53851  ORF Transcript_23386/g.53851 Transcript_23386/m.53851 type:complete len:108 (+) Transcript_23386:172-495(+)